MAIDVMIGNRKKIILDWWTSNKGHEYLTVREFSGSKDGEKWFPNLKNGCHFSLESWEAMIPKLREMIYYKTAPPGAPPFGSDEEGKTFEDRKEPPGDDF